MAWFGPDGNCGCCGPRPCECNTGASCVPESIGYYRNLAIEISEIPNEIFSTFSGFFRPCTSRTCRPTEELAYSRDWRIIGLSQINGTYPISFFNYDEELEEYVEADPADGCGFWGTTNITFQVTFRRTEQDEFRFFGGTPPCHVNFQTGEATINLTFNPFFSEVLTPSYPVNVPGFGNSFAPLIPQTGSVIVPQTETLTGAACSGGSTSAITRNNISNDPFHRPPGLSLVAGGLVRATPAGTARLQSPGGGAGLPAPAPPGMTIARSDACIIGSAENLVESHPVTQTLFNSTGNCGEFNQVFYVGWKVRRRLLFDT